jgi:simple sugar transport system permease protein
MNEEQAAGRFRFPFRLVIDPLKKDNAWWVPFLSIMLALIFCALFIGINGMNPITVYLKMANGAFGSSYGISETLVKAIPLLLCGLGVSIAYRIQIWNIGAEGQFAVGALAATSITIYWPNLPEPLMIPAMVVMGTLGGAIWGLLSSE